MTKPIYSVAERALAQRWRPEDTFGRRCGYTFRSTTCTRSGAHYCEPRATRVVRFFAELLVHTRGAFARTAFILEPWQEFDIIRPLFGEVLWSHEYGRYVRRYRIGYIIVARKNGKSELAAGIQLYMLVGDDEEAAEVYSAASDTKQAGKVFEPALRMVQLSPELRRRLKHIRNARRLVDEQTASIYEVLTADAAGELGHNPHAFGLDEVVALPDAGMWTTMTTATGARTQELLYATTTETSDSVSFGAKLIDDAERVQEAPDRAPHVFAYVRKFPGSQDDLDRLHRLFPNHPDLPISLDWTDEANWKWPNPALDRFKSRESMRRQAIEAIASPTSENGFRQFQLNQRVQQVTRYIPMDLWDANIGDLALRPDWWDEKLRGATCWAGLDLSSKLDMTAWCLLFGDGSVKWRFWLPESVVPKLSDATGGDLEQWVRDGWITATDGDAIDYDRVHADINADAAMFRIVGGAFDRWSGEPIRQRVKTDTGLELLESGTTFTQMTGPMTEAMRLLTKQELRHGGNPVARWCAENLQVKRPRDDPDRVRPVKPERGADLKRIDAMPALFFAIEARGSIAQRVSAYESSARVVV